MRTGIIRSTKKTKAERTAEELAFIYLLTMKLATSCRCEKPRRTLQASRTSKKSFAQLRDVIVSLSSSRVCNEHGNAINFASPVIHLVLPHIFSFRHDCPGVGGRALRRVLRQSTG